MGGPIGKTAIHSTSANAVLSAMAAPDRERLRPYLQTAELVFGRLLFDAGATIDRVYFPTGSIISAVSIFEDGAVAEMTTIGCEGIAPVALLLESGTVVNRYKVQVSGSAYVMDAGPFRQALDESPTLRPLLLRYLHAFIGQIMQSVACNAVHSAEARFARWLLMTHDRVQGGTFGLTQQILAEMLGVHRPTVTLIARTFQHAGLIRYSRGSITVADRRGLEEMSCECYGVVRRQYEAHLPKTAPWIEAAATRG